MLSIPAADARSKPPHHEHAVQFYETEAYLAQVVGRFLAEGLKSGQPLVVIASEAHRKVFQEQLAARGVDCAAAEHAGQLTLLDAREWLAKFMIDGLPDPDLFATHVGALLGSISATTGSSRVRTYGEMVDVLWQEGNQRAAIGLEELWNDLAGTHSFSLLCAYVMGNFYQETHGAGFDSVFRSHAHAFPLERAERSDAAAEWQRPRADLRLQARALELELEQRKQLELALREALAARRQTEADLADEITERKRLEEELRCQNGELLRTVRLSELFVGILGHDLRNPLSAIMTGAGLLMRRADSDQVALPATKILGSARRMGKMIDQLLDFTRIRLGKGLLLERAKTDLREICKAAIDELQMLDAGQRVKLAVEGDCVGQWDGDRLAQLVSNLVGNALAYGSPEEVVRVKLDGSRLESIALEVRGGGFIAPEHLAGIFEPFESSSNRKRPNSSGLGLGLYIGQQIVSGHAGTIEVASTEADGTCFVVELPRS